jgi:hypothetical protein
VTPTRDQVSIARRIINGNNRQRRELSDREIMDRMEKLKKIHKGEGHPMYESFRIILGERRFTQEQRLKV